MKTTKGGLGGGGGLWASSMAPALSGGSADFLCLAVVYGPICSGALGSHVLIKKYELRTFLSCCITLRKLS